MLGHRRSGSVDDVGQAGRVLNEQLRGLDVVIGV